MAYLELLAPDGDEIKLPLGAGQILSVDAMPIMVTSPVSTKQVKELNSEAEETDFSTLPPGFRPEEDE